MHILLHPVVVVHFLSCLQLPINDLLLSSPLQLLAVLLLQDLLADACFVLLSLVVLGLLLDDCAPLVDLAVLGHRVVPLLLLVQALDIVLLLVHRLLHALGVKL